MSQIKDRPDFSVLQTVLLRSMSQAVYGPEEKGHFGLAYEHYAHFTSPIRRYPDLLVHRAIKSIIYSQKANEFDDVKVAHDADVAVLSKSYKYSYDLAAMLVLGEQCSMAERRADEATRDVMSWLKCEYLQQHLGEEFKGIISAVTGFGFFVELADLYAEGLVHVSTLDRDYYQFDAAKHRLIGERSSKSFGLGDKVVVQVSNINLEERKVDLVLVSADSPRGGSRRKQGEVKRGKKPEVNARNSARKKKERGAGEKSSKKPSSKSSAKPSLKAKKGKARQSGEGEEKVSDGASRRTIKRKPSKLESLKSKQVKKAPAKAVKVSGSEEPKEQPVVRKRKAKKKG
jgi:ribonuclease R